MIASELELYADTLDGAAHLLEYGSGGSTVFVAAKFPKLEVVSVDSDLQWFNKLREQESVKRGEEERRLRLLHVDIGPTGDWGYPTDSSRKASWPLYPERPWEDGAAMPDVVLVDGRFRVACVLRSLIEVDPKAKLVVHDFWNRPHYHVVLPYLEWISSAGSLGVFRKRDGIDPTALKAALENYQFIPD